MLESKGERDKADTILCLLKTQSPSFYRVWGGEEREVESEMLDLRDTKVSLLHG